MIFLSPFDDDASTDDPTTEDGSDRVRTSALVSAYTAAFAAEERRIERQRIREHGPSD